MLIEPETGTCETKALIPMLFLRPKLYCKNYTAILWETAYKQARKV